MALNILKRDIADGGDPETAGTLDTLILTAVSEYKVNIIGEPNGDN